ncbi:GbsR/MarR family transcriptional regulator [Agarilytica rhodophyticola]|uniref:GbsR/MarR family transcriptional regulator n=1 Tax=Agarilytica rhodophyticola TaxID=1737490 RepID=UPI000B3427FF|nr:GbsR/MarR family transcriptional regulator [Agarilytica rhodophyticola]
MQMTPKVQSFVMHFGEMGSRWGINRTVGQLFALLVIHEEPLNAEELGAALSISRGNVSMGLKELQSWRLVKPYHVPGDRKEYYSAVGDVWDMGIKVLEERRKREIDPTLSVLRDLLLEAPTNTADTFAHKKMEEIHDLLELVSNWSADLQDMSHDNLKTLMKLGAGVGKVLDIKDRLLNKKAQNGTELE